MSPIVNTIVTSVFTAAATEIAKKATSEIHHCYQYLKRCIKQRYQDAFSTLEKIERNPYSQDEHNTLAKKLEESGVADDEDLVSGAQRLLDAIIKRETEASSQPLFDIETLRAARNVEISNVETRGSIIKARHAEIGGDLKVTGIRQQAPEKK